MSQLDKIRASDSKFVLRWQKGMSDLERSAGAICANFGRSVEYVKRIYHDEFGENRTRIERGREGRSWEEMVNWIGYISVNCGAIGLKFRQ